MGGGRAIGAPGMAQLLSLGAIQVDLAIGLVRGPEGETRLSELETRVLRVLLDAGGAPVARGALLERAWGYRATMVTRTVDVTLARLRVKLEVDAGDPRYLLTTRGEGYRLRLPEAPEEPAGSIAAAPPPRDHPVVGREAEVAELLAALPARTCQIVGLPGMGRRSLAQAVAAAWPGEVAWVDLHGAADVVARVADRLGCAPDRANVLAAVAAWPGLLVFDGASGRLPFPLGGRRLVIGGAVERALTVSVGPLDAAVALSALRVLSPRSFRSEEEAAVVELASRARGAPVALARLARRLRYESAPTILASLSGPLPPDPEWAEALARLSAEAQGVAAALAWFPLDFPFTAAEAVAGSTPPLDELVLAGFLVPRWSARGEIRLRLVGDLSRPPPPQGLARWLSGLSSVALEREFEIALTAAIELPASASASLLASLHPVCRVRGGWERYGSALEALADDLCDAALWFARGEARWQLNRPEPALAALDEAASRSFDTDLLSLRGLIRHRLGRLEDARADFAAIAGYDDAGARHGRILAALIDSEAGRFEGVEERIRTVLEAWEREGNRRGTARARHYLAQALQHRADPRAVAMALTAIAELRALDAPTSAAIAGRVLAAALLDQGRFQEAEVVLAQSAQERRDSGLVQHAFAAERFLAVVHVGRGALVEALARLTPLLEGAAAAAGEGAMAWAVVAWLRGRLGGDSGEAVSHARALATAADPEAQLLVGAWLHAAGLGPEVPIEALPGSSERRLIARITAAREGVSGA